MNEKQLIAQRQKQLSGIYDPQEKFIQQQQAALPGQFAGQRSALEQAKVNAFRDIGHDARTRGRAWGGFSTAEEGRYLGEKFLPGMQDITARQDEARLGLLGQLIGLRGQRAETMVGFQDQLRKERLEREAEQRAAQREMQMQREKIAAQARASGGGGLSVSDQIKLRNDEENAPRMFVGGSKNGNTRFNFNDRKGNAISAARYAELTKQDIRSVLQQMGQQGDRYAKQVYNQLKADPNPAARLGQYKTQYSPLFWGT